MTSVVCDKSSAGCARKTVGLEFFDVFCSRGRRERQPTNLSCLKDFVRRFPPKSLLFDLFKIQILCVLLSSIQQS